jgi:hypothetical protein
VGVMEEGVDGPFLWPRLSIIFCITPLRVLPVLLPEDDDE